jgi:hypothetical protein
VEERRFTPGWRSYVSHVLLHSTEVPTVGMSRRLVGRCPCFAMSKAVAIRINLLFIFLSLTACAQRQPATSSHANDGKAAASVHEGEPLNVDFCDLVQAPEKYEQKLIRIRTLYCYCFEDTELYSSKCPVQRSFWVQGSFKKCTNAGRIDDFESPAKDELAFPRWGGHTVGIVAVGRLIGTKGGYGHMNAFAYLFNVECLERAELIDRQGKRPAEMTKEQRRKVEEFENSN